MATEAPAPPQDSFLVYCGTLEGHNTTKLVATLNAAVILGVPRVHLLLQSTGGLVGEGVFLFNYLRGLPLDLTIYNVGQVSSAAVLFYLGARRRVANRNAGFMLHRTSEGVVRANLFGVEATYRSLQTNDARTMAILTQEIRLSGDMERMILNGELLIGAEEALGCGLVTEIGEFDPTPGARVFDVLS